MATIAPSAVPFDAQSPTVAASLAKQVADLRKSSISLKDIVVPPAAPAASNVKAALQKELEDIDAQLSAAPSQSQSQSQSRKRALADVETAGAAVRMQSDAAFLAMLDQQAPHREHDDHDASALAQDSSLLNGVAFTHVAHKIIAHTHTKDGSERRYARTVSGSCSGMPFHVVAEVNEARGAVTSLEISVPAHARRHMQGWLAAVQKTCALQQFFKMYALFGELCAARAKTMTHVANKWPQWAHLSEGPRSDFLRFDAAKEGARAHAHFNFEWTITVADDGKVSQSLDLTPVGARDLWDRDSESVLARLRDNFAGLCRIKGPTVALDVVATLVVDGCVPAGAKA